MEVRASRIRPAFTADNVSTQPIRNIELRRAVH